MRLFGGWGFEGNDALRRDFAVVGYSNGGPMVSDLVAATEEGRSLEFLAMHYATPSRTNSIGSAELGIVWADPDFAPALKAFYYARVIEIPTPHWTADDRVKYDQDLPVTVPFKIQDRAFTSSIWYTPQG